MPNGFYGAEQEWQRREAPLLELDEGIAAFAGAHGIKVVRNYHGDDPNRMLRWTSRGLERTIQLSREGAEPLAFFIALYAWKDTAHERFTRQLPTRWGIPGQQMKAELHALLEEAYLAVEQLSEEDLELSTKSGS